MKKTIIFISVILFILLSALTYYLFIFQVEFDIKQSDLNITIYNIKDKEISKINKSDKKYLLKGNYYFVINNEKYSNNKNYFSVNKNNKIIINPDYSNNYLEDLLITESDSIINKIFETYPNIINNYDILNMNLYKKGEWFGAIIRKKTNNKDITDNYRIIMNKIGNNWTIINYPEIVLLKNNYKNVPVEIINSTNKLSI